jgi:hypothetical protein
VDCPRHRANSGHAAQFRRRCRSFHPYCPRGWHIFLEFKVIGEFALPLVARQLRNLDKILHLDIVFIPAAPKGIVPGLRIHVGQAGIAHQALETQTTRIGYCCRVRRIRRAYGRCFRLLCLRRIGIGGRFLGLLRGLPCIDIRLHPFIAIPQAKHQRQPNIQIALRQTLTAGPPIILMLCQP